MKILTDPGLPSLTDEQLQTVLGRAREIIRKHYDKDVSFVPSGREPLAGLLKRLNDRVGPFQMEARLNPLVPLTENEGRFVYRSVFSDLNKDRIGWALTRMGRSPDITDMNRLFPAFMDRLAASMKSLSEARRLDGEPVLRPQSRDAQSLYAWFVLLNGLPRHELSADILLTPDLLLHDALPSIPVDALLNGSMVYGYTKHYPGVVMVSTLPFLSADPVFAARQGKLTDGARLDLIAWVLAGELGGEYLRGEELNAADAGCPSGWIEEPYEKELADIASGGCDRPHDRYDLQKRYIEHIGAVVGLDVRDGRYDAADSAWQELKAALPDDPSVGQVRRFIDREKDKQLQK